MTEGEKIITEIWYILDLVDALMISLIISAIIKTTAKQINGEANVLHRGNSKELNRDKCFMV